jgi:integrase
VGEAIGLDRHDVDLEQDRLTVRQAKGNRSRLVPIHPSTRKALRRYERLRDQICPKCVSPSFFISDRGARLTDGTVRYWFICVSHQTGLRQLTDHRGPRLHDLRHLFSIKTLLHWYRTSRDVETHLPERATYLGHRHVADTYW